MFRLLNTLRNFLALLALAATASCGADSDAQSTVLGPLLRGPRAAAQTDAVDEDPQTVAAAATLDEQQAQVRAQLRVAQKEASERPPTATAESPATARQVDALEQLDVMLDRQRAATDRGAKLQVDLDAIQDSIESLRRDGLKEEPPYSFNLLDAARDEVKTQQARVEALKQTTDAALGALERAREAAVDRKRTLQTAQEKLEANQDPLKRAELSDVLKESEIANQIAEAELRLRNTELANERLEQEIDQSRLTLLEDRLQILEASAKFTPQDLHERLLEVENEDDALRLRRQGKESEKVYLEEEWAKAKRAADAADGEQPELDAVVTALEKEREAVDEAVELLNIRLAWIQTTKRLWEYRYSVDAGLYETSDLKAWQEAAETFLADIASERGVDELKLQAIRKETAEIERKLKEAEDQPPAQRVALRRQLTTLRERAEAINDHIVFMESHERLAEKLLADIDDRTVTFDPNEWGWWIWDNAKSVWDYPILEPADSRPIRVRTVIKGLLLLILGMWASRLLSDAFSSRVLPRFGVHEGAAAALRSLTFYALVVTSALMALRFVQVPLTVFTFLGGAAAIGLGFGSQNILNNFISGLIMLVEQPIRVGDLVELTELAGTVETIGMRSTRIRTPSNQEMIVPNSTFLQNNVLNWTLSDSTVRCMVPVGVAYGSPTREVARRLKQAADKHGMVLSKPEPFVWFTGFGDNSLNFELHFFIVIRTLAERRRIESDLRFMIDQQFRDADIVIAFPQRDVHLDTMRPLEVRMLPPANEPEPEPEPPAIGSPASAATTPAPVVEAPTGDEGD